MLTDRYSLAVVLFKLFFRGDPLEGSKVLQCVVMTEENDLIHYGKDPVFIYDPNNASNRPVMGYTIMLSTVEDLPGLYQRGIYPFLYLWNPGAKCRIIEKSWIQMLIQLKLDIIHCSCGKTAFSSAFEKTGEHTLRCRNCGSTIYTMGVKDYELPLNLGAKSIQCLTRKIVMILNLLRNGH